MVDQFEETDLKIAPADITPGTAVSGLRKDLRKELQESGALTLDELLNLVYKWENVYGERLSEHDFEVLSLLSLTLGTSKLVLGKKVGIGKEYKEKKRAFLESINSQQEILKTVLGNLDESGRPNKALMRSLGLVTEIFEDYFNLDNPKLTDPGIETEAGFWQGVQGMVTTAFLFRESGWQVKLPKAELDLYYDMDLLVKNPRGEVYAVDVTAKRPQFIGDTGEFSSAFYVQKKAVPQDLPKGAVNNLKGYLKVNVPPLIHYSANAFYKDRMTGFPKKDSIVEFSELVGKLT